jgi:hypothetical protein
MPQSHLAADPSSFLFGRLEAAGLETKEQAMTVGDLREIINDPDISDDTPLRLLTTIHGKMSRWEWDLVGAYGTLAGEDRALTLQLDAYDPALDTAST